MNIQYDCPNCKKTYKLYNNYSKHTTICSQKYKQTHKQLTTINIEKQQALTQINISAYNAISNITNMVDDDSFVYEIKNELLQKIDYIFEMFFHANSKIIMENYPI